MSTELSVTAQKWLRRVENRSLSQDRVRVTASKTLEEVRQFCDENDIAFPSQQPLYLSRATLGRIKAVFDYSKDVSQMDRPQVAQHRGGGDEKQAGIRPTEYLALLAVTDKSLLEQFAEPFYSTCQLNMELDVTKPDLSAYSHLVVVENRDSFNDWHKYDYPEILSHALVIYRGDKGHSRACKRLKERWQEEQPDKRLIYFGDMDSSGVHIALTGRYDALLLPGQEHIEQYATREHWPARQTRHMNRLSRDCPPGWHALYQLFEQRGRGLRQQLMYDTPLVLYPS